MLFNSWEFLILLGVTFVLYYGVGRGRWRRGWQVGLLLSASALFYGWQNFSLLILLGVSCGGNTGVVFAIQKCRERGSDPKWWVRMAVIANLLLLGFFKYAEMLAGILGSLLPESLAISAGKIPLPIGISFYTFQAISLVVDAGKERRPESGNQKGGSQQPVASPLDIPFYISFFPQLIAGPIVKARLFLPQIAGKFFGKISWGRAARYLVSGYFLKMVVADNLAPVTTSLKSISFIEASNGATLLVYLFGYSMQIFADFCGYSLIAIGLGLLFGYRLPHNFNFPYLSTSITQFWQTWNMTLSSWLKEYLYIPLGGNRCGAVRTYFNLMLVMFLGGLWHGADWRFALWGILHGLLLAIERMVGVGKRKTTCHLGTRDSTNSIKSSQSLESSTQPSKVRQSLPTFRLPLLYWFYCFVAVSLLWSTFLMPDMQTLGAFFQKCCFSFSVPWKEFFMNPGIYAVAVFGAAVVFFHGLGWIRRYRAVSWRHFLGSPAEALLYGIMIFLLLTNSGPQSAFVYFQF